MYGDRLTDRTLSAQPGNLALLLLNAVGAVAYVYRASPSWAIPEERQAGIYTTTGEPFVWFAGILPVLTLFFIVNFAWAALIITPTMEKQSYVAAGSSMLARCGMGRFRAPLRAKPQRRSQVVFRIRSHNPEV
jgi:hypothetical protein